MSGTRRPPDFEAPRERLRARLAAVVGDGPIARLDEALTHKSYANEEPVRDNQRLEFLGDAVLGLCVSEVLVARHPDANEGQLTRMRAALVNADALARWGRAEGVGACLALGRGARGSSEQEKTNVVADAVEALIAAVYLEKGLEAARALCLEIVREPMEGGEEVLSTRDPKSLLQERVQALGHASPTYRVVESSGPPHEPRFVVEACLEGRVLAIGEGRSKRQAERDAAQRALAEPPPPAQRDDGGDGAP
jgi:ribonuclease-3